MEMQCMLVFVIFQFIIAVYLRMIDCQVLPRCPYALEWNLRALALCKNITKYTCLEHGENYFENCNGNGFDRPGVELINRGGFDRRDCEKLRYQPFPFTTVESSKCVFQKSNCSEEGQITVNLGTTTDDANCRCDNKKGYAFVSLTRGVCACNPSQEECSCYIKTCDQPHYQLFPDYECTFKHNYTSKCTYSELTSQTDKPSTIYTYTDTEMFSSNTMYILILMIITIILLKAFIVSIVLLHRIMRRVCRGYFKQKLDIEDYIKAKENDNIDLVCTGYNIKTTDIRDVRWTKCPDPSDQKENALPDCDKTTYSRPVYQNYKCFFRLHIQNLGKTDIGYYKCYVTLNGNDLQFKSRRLYLDI